ncbi:MAG: DUF1015 family protein [Desulfohalobiaceae bacterium]|nr:DUF1015 family protein [Desulfohalobiaceae bacterium]
MPSIHPFPCYFVKPAWATEVVTPSYDAFSPDERAAFVRDNPGNYLSVIRSLDEFSGPDKISLDELLELNAASLKALMASGKFACSDRPCLYLYRLISGEHEQTGLVCEIPVDEYEDGQSIKVHEQTRQDKEDQLLAYLDKVGASSSPVCCTYRHQTELDSLIQSFKENNNPLLDFQTRDGVRHTVWRIGQAEPIKRFVSLFAAVPVSYLTDGHHRAAAALRYAKQQREKRLGNYSGAEAFDFLLVAFFPDDQLQILPYNRCVKDLDGLTPSDFLQRLDEHFQVEKIDKGPATQCLPDRPRRFTCLLKDQWYDLRLRPEVNIPDDPVQSLDVSLLHRLILEPLLGIKEARTDRRISYISGISGEQGMESACRQGFEAAFACFGTSVEELIAVAEAGRVMPPKSTWFEPKVRSGLFLRFRNRDR